MKKILIIIMAFCLLTGCGQEKTNNEANSKKTDAVSEQKNLNQTGLTKRHIDDANIDINTEQDAVSTMRLIGSTVVTAEYLGKTNQRSKEIIDEHGDKLHNDYITYSFKLDKVLAYESSIPDEFELAIGVAGFPEFNKGQKFLFQMRKDDMSDGYILDSIVMFLVDDNDSLISVFRDDEKYNGYKTDEFAELLKK